MTDLGRYEDGLVEDSLLAENEALRRALDAYRAAVVGKYAETPELKALYEAALGEPWAGTDEIERGAGQC